MFLNLSDQTKYRNYSELLQCCMKDVHLIMYNGHCNGRVAYEKELLKIPSNYFLGQEYDQCGPVVQWGCSPPWGVFGIFK